MAIGKDSRTARIGPRASIMSGLKTLLLGSAPKSAVVDNAPKAPAESTCRFRLKDGAVVAIKIPTPQPIPDRPSTFVLGIYKGGSTLLNVMMNQILSETGRFSINLPNTLLNDRDDS